MMLQEQYTRLLEKGREQDALTLLRSLGPEERKALAPVVKKLSKEYLTYEMVGNTYKQKASQAQSNIINYTAFVCYNRNEFAKAGMGWFISKEFLNKVLPWYCPSWFSDHINSLSGNEWLPAGLSYEYLMELTDNGYLQPQPQLIARILPQAVYEHRGQKHYFKPENLLVHQQTLHEHIWYLFEYETTVHFSNRYIWFDGEKKIDETGWITIFRKYAGEGRIDRQRLLRESLLASNRNFDKNLSGWFAELFVQLEPSAEELLSLQPELTILFSSPHSKPVNVALQSIKQIVEDASFDAEAFLHNVPLLLASDTKSIVTATLAVLEKLVKKLPAHRAAICSLATGALLHKDDVVQTRAAKLIARWGDPVDENLKAAIRPYTPTLFSKAKDLLQPFAAEQPVTEAPTVWTTVGPGPALADATPLPEISDVEDLVFLASQAFDNNQSWHIDLLPAALIRLHPQVRGAAIAKLEPAFQRALKLFYVEWSSRLGYLDQLLAYFFLDYGVLLMQRDPEGATSLRKLYESHISKQVGNWQQWQEHNGNISYLAGWKHHAEGYLYEPYRGFLTMVLERLQANDLRPLLSTPTHAPAWIDPLTLVQRLRQYHRQDPPDYTDLQVALSRCWLHEGTEALAAAREMPEGEDKALLLFLLTPGEKPHGPFVREWAWMMAALAKAPQVEYPAFKDFYYSQQPRARYTGQHPWKVSAEDYTYDKYNWSGGKMHTTKAWATRKSLRLDLSALAPSEKKTNGFKKFWNKITGVQEEQPSLPPSLLYEHLYLKGQFLSVEDRDIRRLMMLTPHNPEPVMALALHICLGDPSFTSETDKRFTIEVLQGLHDLSSPLGETGHLFIATCMTCSDKTAVAYAAELWIRYVTEQKIDSTRIGAILGVQQSIEFAPLKRFTDLVASQLLGLSPVHNRALESLLEAMLIALPATPLKGVKKLLELYFEVLALNGTKPENEDLKLQLQEWKASAGLNKLLKARV